MKIVDSAKSKLPKDLRVERKRTDRFTVVQSKKGSGRASKRTANRQPVDYCDE